MESIIWLSESSSQMSGRVGTDVARRLNPRLQAKKEEEGFEFYKIIHQPSNTPQQCLRLPPKFVQKFSKDLSDFALLSVPDGKRWQLKLWITGGEIFLRNGWQEFLEYYSISAGHFLLFRYSGKSNFRVIIFGMNCSEMHYPPNIDDLEEANSCEESEEEGLIISDTDVHNSSKKQEKVLNIPFAKGPSFTRTSAAKRSSFKEHKDNGAIGLPGGLKLKHPYFKVLMQPSYVTNYTPIPPSFVKRYLKDNSRNLTLEASNGRTWVVQFIVYNNHRAHLSKGWPKFAKQNKIKEGDVCVFEMIKDAFLKVHIFPKAKDKLPTILNMKDGHQSPEKQEDRVDESRALKAARALKLKYPSFTIFPFKFLKKHLTEKLDHVTLQVSDECTWPVGCLFYRGWGRMSKGWPIFQRENDIKEGDVCVFEMIEKEDVVFKVYIFHC
ncbi:hypothetical protein IFM89_034532 [Coptis chinensis]|uniref:TF-B3 domain-containing protein n=1 Tax=Coptis chinensis TaxID=261450 RepID=A0A835HRD8_9MAGN|nr:hypothetical protein IFM89_034532 [Coptis chinensis]